MYSTLLVALVALLCVSVAQNPTQSGTSRDPSCCNCNTYRDDDCPNPTTIATGLQANCPGGDCSTCPTCENWPNPAFTKQCEANVVFIIDNSGSLEDFCVATVRPALWNFFDGFVNVANVGGTVRAAVLTFSQTTQLVFDMTDVTSGTFVADVKTWVAGFPDPNNRHPGYCKMMSGTNWGGPLQTAAAINYGVTVDIWIFFTDGFPQCAGQFAPQPSCSRDCYNRGNNFFENNLCNPSSTCQYNEGNDGITFSGDSADTRAGTWTACYYADVMKKLGSKLFVVGVGGLNGHEAKIQLISGTTQWDGRPQTFRDADYIISTDITDLGIIFQQIISGLCDCLQAQRSCENDSGVSNSCEATRFEAFMRVTTDATTTSTVYPAAAVTSGKIYYNFIPSPNTRVAFEFWKTGVAIGDAPDLARTDILDPCKIERRVTCGGGCAEISETQRLPRFFRENGDTSCGGTLCSGASNNPTGCNQGFTKTGSNLDEVKYFWTLADGKTPCAAENGDGTFFEFFSSNNPNTRGVIGSIPRTFTFDFNPTSSCVTDVNCTTSVELLLVIDEQTAISAATFTAMKEFAGNVVTKLQPGPTYDSDTTFGFGFTTSYSNTEEPQDLVGMTSGRNFVTNLVLPRPKNGGTSNFVAATTATMNKYWSGKTTPVQRVVLIVIGGGDVPGQSQAAYDGLRTLAQTYGAEIFAVGVDRGASQINLMQKLTTPGSFQRYTAVLNPNNLNLDVEDSFLRLTVRGICPQSNLCGSDCQGFCECSAPGSCKCPTCSDKLTCTTYQCVNPLVGCKGQPFLCNDGAACTTDQCVEPTGCQYTLTNNCNTGCSCVNATGECYCPIACTSGCPDTACFNQTCDTNTGTCVITWERDCNDGNPCTVDSCENPGGCRNEALTCEQTSTCFTTECVGTLSNGQPNCQQTAAINCTDNDSCTEDSCVENFGCRNQNITCSATSDCNFPYACVGKDENGNELPERQCLITNSTCFAGTIDAGTIAGITAGIIAAIVIAAVIVALLIAFLSKKGYDAYTARSDMGVPSMMQNPTFTENSVAGEARF